MRQHSGSNIAIQGASKLTFGLGKGSCMRRIVLHGLMRRERPHLFLAPKCVSLYDRDLGLRVGFVNNCQYVFGNRPDHVSIRKVL